MCVFVNNLMHHRLTSFEMWSSDVPLLNLIHSPLLLHKWLIRLFIYTESRTKLIITSTFKFEFSWRWTETFDTLSIWSFILFLYVFLSLSFWMSFVTHPNDRPFTRHFYYGLSVFGVINLLKWSYTLNLQWKQNEDEHQRFDVCASLCFMFESFNEFNYTKWNFV